MTQRSLPSSKRAVEGLSHVVLRTANIDQTLAWYSIVLGAHVVWKNEMGAALTFDAEHHRLALIAVPPAKAGPAPRTEPGLEHIAFKAGGLGELLSQYAAIRDHDIHPALTLNHIGTVSMYYRDPDGVLVELFCDAMTPDQATETMSSPQFTKNPVGVPFDPDNLLERYLAGEPIARLVEQPELDEAGLAKLIAFGGGTSAVAETVTR
ncbi:VOC family protein [Mycobacterium sp. Marseille-P9652]|uniref:VOC family protein n=1 Tax=Mycobacterium sp. Marseille-P9652 TaxID=2654950 RepID=UPI0012E753A6|nr:VOC family protein [Mycobacterium sp. Marseille-P9652]